MTCAVSVAALPLLTKKKLLLLDNFRDLGSCVCSFRRSVEKLRAYLPGMAPSRLQVCSLLGYQRHAWDISLAEFGPVLGHCMAMGTGVAMYKG